MIGITPDDEVMDVVTVKVITDPLIVRVIPVGKSEVLTVTELGVICCVPLNASIVVFVDPASAAVALPAKVCDSFDRTKVTADSPVAPSCPSSSLITDIVSEIVPSDALIV